MIKWFKKHCKKLIIASSILTACICGLFGFTKSYAYENDSDNNLVGNDLLQNARINTINYNGFNYGDYISITPCQDYFGFDMSIDKNYYQSGFANRYIDLISNFSPIVANGSYTFVLMFDCSNFLSSNALSSSFSISSCDFNNGNFIRTYNSDNLADFAGVIGSDIGFISGGRFKATPKTIYYNGNNFALRLNFPFVSSTNGVFRVRYMLFKNDLILSNALSSNSIYYNASSIEDLQNAYNNLLSQYNDYVASHSYSNTQYNDLVASNTLLQQQISTLQLQYDTYVASHSHTNEEYNNLLSGYEDLLDIHRDLESDYDDLQQRYDELYSSYDEIYNTKNHGYFNYLDYIEFSNGDYTSGHKTLDDLVDDYIIEKLSLDVNNAFTQYVEHQLAYNYIDIYFLNETVPLELFELDFYEFSNASLTLEFYNVVLEQSRSISINLSNANNVVNGYTVLRALWGDSFTHEQYEEYISNSPATLYITYIQVYGDFSTSGEIYDTAINSGLAIDGDSYNFGYNQGYAIATRGANNIKAENASLKGTISTLENTNNQLQQDYNNLNSTYHNLRQSYNDLLAGRNDLSTLFFTIAQTPFETFKTIWNVDFLGVNLAGFFTGIIMLGLMLWIVKKIF